MNFKYNEKLYGETIYKNGFQTDFIKSELTILVKYLKQIKGLNKKDTEKEVYDFCKKHIEGFNEVQYFKVIDRAISNGRKGSNKLIVVKDIPILKSELEYIDKLKKIDNEYKKLLLSFIVHKKISFEIHKLMDENANMSGYFGGSNRKYREIFKTANITEKGYNIDEMINKLVEEGIILSIVKGDIVLEYMYEIYPITEEIIKVMDKKTEKLVDKIKKTIIYEAKEDDIYDKINDFENIGYIFDYYKGLNNIIKCNECGKYIKKKNNKNTYCSECAKQKQLEWQRESMKKLRNKK